MNDKELANAVLVLLPEIVVRSNGMYRVLPSQFYFPAKSFVRDWRVVGVLIEKCEAIAVEWFELEPEHWRNMNHTSNTPRAIAEICVKLLTNYETITPQAGNRTL